MTVNHMGLLMFQEKQPFERIEVSRDEALEMFSDNNFKASESVNFFTINTHIMVS